METTEAASAPPAVRTYLLETIKNLRALATEQQKKIQALDASADVSAGNAVIEEAAEAEKMLDSCQSIMVVPHPVHVAVPSPNMYADEVEYYDDEDQPADEDAEPEPDEEEEPVPAASAYSYKPKPYGSAYKPPPSQDDKDLQDAIAASLEEAELMSAANDEPAPETPCPICGSMVKEQFIHAHIDRCLEKQAQVNAEMEKFRWECVFCSFRNDPGLKRCSMCNGEAPAGAGDVEKKVPDTAHAAPAASSASSAASSQSSTSPASAAVSTSQPSASSSSKAEEKVSAQPELVVPSDIACVACAQKHPSSVVKSLSLCGHSFCAKCLKSYVEPLVAGDALKLRCSVNGCNHSLSPLDLHLVLSEKAASAYWNRVFDSLHSSYPVSWVAPPVIVSTKTVQCKCKKSVDVPDSSTVQKRISDSLSAPASPGVSKLDSILQVIADACSPSCGCGQKCCVGACGGVHKDPAELCPGGKLIATSWLLGSLNAMFEKVSGKSESKVAASPVKQEDEAQPSAPKQAKQTEAEQALPAEPSSTSPSKIGLFSASAPGVSVSEAQPAADAFSTALGAAPGSMPAPSISFSGAFGPSSIQPASFPALPPFPTSSAYPYGYPSPAHPSYASPYFPSGSTYMPSPYYQPQVPVSYSSASAAMSALNSLVSSQTQPSSQPASAGASSAAPSASPSVPESKALYVPKALAAPSNPNPSSPFALPVPSSPFGLPGPHMGASGIMTPMVLPVYDPSLASAAVLGVKKKTKAPKGIGYEGNDSVKYKSTVRAKAKAQNEQDACVAALLECLRIMLGDRGFTGEFGLECYALLFKSTLNALLAFYLRNDSLTDQSRRSAIYYPVYHVCRTLGVNDDFLPLLRPDGSSMDASIGSHVSLSKMLTATRKQAALFLSKPGALLENMDQDSLTVVSLAADIKDVGEIIESHTGKHLGQLAAFAACLDQGSSSGAAADDDEKKVANTDSVIESYLRNTKFDTVDIVNCPVQHIDIASVNAPNSGFAARGRLMRLRQEIASLSSDLPDGIFVRADSNRFDVLRAVIIGPKDTPYENGIFAFDIFLPGDYPNQPPHCTFTTTNHGTFRFNPNLYSNGKVCLSLLGTWSGPGWDPKISTLLQVLVSIQSMILCDEPYYNEPGWAAVRGTPQEYLARIYENKLRHGTLMIAIVDALKNPPPGFEDVVRAHFWLKRDEMLKQIERWSEMDANAVKMAAEKKATGQYQGGQFSEQKVSTPFAEVAASARAAIAELKPPAVSV